MILAAVLLAAGLVVLAFGADQLVVGSSRLATARGISPIVVGALVIGFGTSAPEMLVSGLAAADGNTDLGVGNVVGSNVANLSLVLGIAALVATLSAGHHFVRVLRSTLWREGAISVVAAGLFWLLIQDGFQRWEGAVLVGAFAAAMVIILRRPPADSSAVGKRASAVGERASAVGQRASAPGQRDRGRPIRPIRQSFELGRTGVGLVATVAGAQLAVEGSERIALEAGLGTGFVGLSLVAFGTSLPELITGVQAARRGETDLLVGNVLGSNTFNSLLVGAVVAFVGPGPLVDGNLSGLAVWIMMGISAAAWLLMLWGNGLERWWECAMLVAVYLVSMPFLISDHQEPADNASPAPEAPAPEVPVSAAPALAAPAPALPAPAAPAPAVTTPQIPPTA